MCDPNRELKESGDYYISFMRPGYAQFLRVPFEHFEEALDAVHQLQKAAASGAKRSRRGKAAPVSTFFIEQYGRFVWASDGRTVPAKPKDL
jgi:hypothetical protein